MKKIKKVIALTLAAAVVATAALATPATTTPAQAATTVTATKSYKKAPTVKTGTSVVKMKKNFYYVKFKAPKAGTYKLTYTDIKSRSGDEIGYGCHYVKKVNDGYMQSQVVKTNGGKDSTLWVCTKYCWNNFDKARYSGKTGDYRYNRTATIKLKKGEVIYLYGHFSGENPSYKYTVNIKKIK